MIYLNCGLKNEDVSDHHRAPSISDYSGIEALGIDGNHVFLKLYSMTENLILLFFSSTTQRIGRIVPKFTLDDCNMIKIN